MVIRKLSPKNRKFPKSGSSTARALIALGALVFFLLYVTSVGVSASTQASNVSVAGTVNVGQRTVTRTITKTIHDTTTVVLVKTDTTTKTQTSTTTSAVCCETVTTTVTSPPSTVTQTSTNTVTDTTTSTTVSTVTETPSISGSAQNVVYSYSASTQDTPIFTNSADCAITVTLRTTGVVAAIAAIQLYWSDTNHDNYYATIANPGIGDTSGFYATLSGDSVDILATFASSTTNTVGVGISYTAICPS